MTDSAAPSKPSKLPVTVNKPTPYTFDLGLLLAEDPNPLLLSSPANLEADLAATARDGAQALLNQLLSTCPIAATPNGVLLSLPEISTRLPREKVRFSIFFLSSKSRNFCADVFFISILTRPFSSRFHHRKR
jgi:regulator of ribosome biosynthesis